MGCMSPVPNEGRMWLLWCLVAQAVIRGLLIHLDDSSEDVQTAVRA